MFKLRRFIKLTVVLLAIVAADLPSFAQSSSALGQLTGKDTIYQILTDRFYDGDATSNKPDGSTREDTVGRTKSMVRPTERLI